MTSLTRCTAAKAPANRSSMAVPKRSTSPAPSPGAARRGAPFCLVRPTLQLSRARAATGQPTALHPHGLQIRTGVRCFRGGGCCTLLLYEALEPCDQVFELWSLSWCGAMGFEPQTSCMPCSGNTSTVVHLCRSLSQDVRISPPESRPVAVLSCCTVPSVHRCKPERAPLW